ncbi:mitochondrial ribosomal protein L41 [Arctopsyche grandis]|uniref:mitochondrial ribosomal protein L41 n=1 Tax=Arctopsyche grandis TaxID=121162 RepID=UPI00406D7ABD
MASGMCVWRLLIPIAPSLSRPISVSAIEHGKHNFRKFVLRSRGTRKGKEAMARGENPVNYGPGPKEENSPWVVTPSGVKMLVPEKIPELIVPDLTDCELRPYVSYRVPDVVQSEFTPKELFAAVYKKKIVEDFKAGKIGLDGEPLNPSEEEKLTSEKALELARKTGSDIFS